VQVKHGCHVPEGNEQGEVGGDRLLRSSSEADNTAELVLVPALDVVHSVEGRREQVRMIGR